MYSRLSLLPAFVALPTLLFAQDSTARADSTPFRRGQWAAQFQAGSSFGSLGFIKFRSATRALVVDVRINGAHSEALVRDTAGTMRFAGLSSSAFTQLRFGWRRYGGGDGGRANVVSHYTLGVLAGLDHRASASPGGAGQDNEWTVGVFGDLGGTYLLTPRFGLGALGSAALTYSTVLSEQKPPTRKVRTWRLGGSAVSASLVATLFF